MTRPRFAHNPGKTPGLTGGDDRPRTPCMDNRHVYDALIDRPLSAEARYVVEEARAICATCPVWQPCLTANAGEEWAKAVITGKTLQARAAARRAA